MKLQKDKETRLTEMACLIPRTKVEIELEIGKVIKAKEAAKKKIARCDERLVELSSELQTATK